MPGPDCKEGIEMGSRVERGNQASPSLHVHSLLNFSSFLPLQFQSLTSTTSVGFSKHSKASLPVQRIPGPSLLCPQSRDPSSFHLGHLAVDPYHAMYQKLLSVEIILLVSHVGSMILKNGV